MNVLEDGRQSFVQQHGDEGDHRAHEEVRKLPNAAGGATYEMEKILYELNDNAPYSVLGTSVVCNHLLRDSLAGFDPTSFFPFGLCFRVLP